MKTLWPALARKLGAVTLLGLPLLTAAQIDLSITNGTKRLGLPLVPGVDEFKVLRTRNLGVPFAPSSSGAVSGYNWREAGAVGMEFFRVEMQPKDPSEVLIATLLNRLSYGPTPDELARVRQIGADAYVREQLAPEKINESLEIDRVYSGGDWQYVTLTGTASSSTIYLYQTVTGECYVDDLKLVRGSVPETGQNMIPNGDFESGLIGWTVSTNMALSAVVTDVKKSGNASLHLVSSRAGSSQASSIFRADLGLTQNQTYTLSYWYKPGTNRNSGLTIRLSGSGIVSSPDVATRLAENSATVNDLTAWHALHAVQSKKQLLEVMLQFLENHFVTQHRKSTDYLDRYYDSPDVPATNLEYRELQRWRQALLNPQCTFYDLLKISAESPAMIIYLDTVSSRGDGSNVANENYARELLELFTFGVDNGYDQNDITVMSRAWTGWTIRIVDATNEFNPFAVPATNLVAGAPTNTIEYVDGIWAFNYNPQRHYRGEKVIFPGKVVPDRFGPPYAGRDYELKLASSTSGGADWQYVTMSGTASSRTLYLYVTGAGDCYIDDIKIVAGNTPEAGANTVRNGDFESGLTGWTVTPNMSASAVVTDVKRSGNSSLHLVAAAGGTTRGDAIYQDNLTVTQDQPYTLSFWYKPGSRMTGNLVLRLSGRGIDSTPGAGTNSVQEGYQVIQHLADQPFAQEFISVKLCRLFVHDDFAIGYNFTDPNLSEEGKLVRACMSAWENSTPKGQIRKVLEVIFNSELFRSQGASMQKVKTPFEFTVSAVRALRGRAQDGTYTADTDGFALRSPMDRMGRMRLFNRDDPDGYPESGAPWISAGTLAERLRFAQALMLANGAAGKSDANGNSTDPVKLLKDRLPSSAWNDAGAVVDFFLGLLYPGEGKANLDEYRTQAMAFLNTGDDGVASSPFSALGNTTTNYDTRVRGMVAALMTFQRFQEQ